MVHKGYGFAIGGSERSAYLIVEICHRVWSAIAIRRRLRGTIAVPASKGRQFMGGLLGLVLLLNPTNRKGECTSAESVYGHNADETHPVGS